jgi:hypothetical protein
MVDDSTSISWESVYNISHSWMDVLIFMSFYLESCVWPDAICDSCRSKELRQIASDYATSLPMVITGDESWIYGYPEIAESKLTEAKKGDRRRGKSRACSSVLSHQGDCWQRIRPGRPNSQLCILMWLFLWWLRRLRPKIWWQKKSWLLPHDNALFHTSFFTRDFFFFLPKTNMTIFPHPLYSPDLAPCDFLCFPQLKIKMKGRHFDTI